MSKHLLFVLLACIGLTGSSAAEGKQTAAFDKLRSLTGDWEGTYAWTGRDASGKANAQYYLTGNESAVVENLSMDGKLGMTSVYHLDGSDLRMSHFCAAQNQPRLKASATDLDSGTINFSFLDITNLRSPETGHVDGLEMRFLAPDHITLRFKFVANAKESYELIDLKRKK